jgi:ATP-binding cassette subfamily B protein AbcA/BmrA
LVIIIKKNYLSNSDLLIQLGILIFAFSRISPLISKIIIYIQTLNFSQKSVDIINENLHINNELVKRDKNKIEFKNLIEVENINFQYENNLIIKNLSFKIKKNSFNIIKGKSGSGKSTLANILLGELVPQQGKVLVDNVPILDALYSWRKKISYISQNINLIDDSFIKNIAYGIPDQLIDKNKVVACAKISQINNFILEQKNQYETRVGEFGKLISQGQAQRIVIARALYSNTEFLILDEPTSSLDDENSKLFMEDLKKIKNITILMISHDQNLLKYAENVIDL